MSINALSAIMFMNHRIVQLEYTGEYSNGQRMLSYAVLKHGEHRTNRHYTSMKNAKDSVRRMECR
jgi:hypothetical protein